MNWLQFIAAVIGSLAWPTVFIALLYILRAQIRGLAERITEISLPGGAKATFDRQLEAARVIEIKGALGAAEKPDTAAIGAHLERVVPETEESRFLRLAAASPEAAITEAYKKVEAILFDEIAPLLGVKAINAGVIVNELVRRDLTFRGTLELFNTLREARNTAAHVPPGRITTAEAIDYGDHIAKLVSSLSYAFGYLKNEAKRAAEK